MRKKSTPSYRLHKSTGQAVVTIDGRDYYLGRHDSPESHEKYNRLIAEWLLRGCHSPPAAAGSSLTVAELAVKYLAHAETYYRKPDGTTTTEVSSIRLAMRPMNRLYSRLPAAEFSPLKLDAVRAEMIRMGWARTNINHQIARLKQLFKWGVARELIPASVHHGLMALKGLHIGRSEAMESEEVNSADEDAIIAVIGILSPSLATLIERLDGSPPATTGELDMLAAKVPGESHVAAMIYLQWRTGMRPAEACAMRTNEVTIGNDWKYNPATHKTAHHGHTRTVSIGRRAQRILRPFLKTDLSAPIFSPADAEAARHADQRERRQTPMTPSQSKRGLRRKAKREPGDMYTVASYRRAIQRACDQAFPLPAGLAEAWAEVTTWRDKRTYQQHGRAPKLKEYPADLREKRDRVQAFRAAHRWHPHQLRHNAATDIAIAKGEEAARIVLGHQNVKTTRKYIDRSARCNKEAAQAGEIMREVG